MEISKNNKAGQIVWYRKNMSWCITIDMPRELWYICPICQKKWEMLDWSEYNWFLYCRTCNKDIPTCLCMPDIDKAIDIYLDCINFRFINISHEDKLSEDELHLGDTIFG